MWLTRGFGRSKVRKLPPTELRASRGSDRSEDGMKLRCPSCTPLETIGRGWEWPLGPLDGRMTTHVSEDQTGGHPLP